MRYHHAFEGVTSVAFCRLYGPTHPPVRELTYAIAFPCPSRSPCCVEEYTFCQQRDFSGGPRCCSGAYGDSSSSNACSEGDLRSRVSSGRQGPRMRSTRRTFEKMIILVCKLRTRDFIHIVLKAHILDHDTCPPPYLPFSAPNSLSKRSHGYVRSGSKTQSATNRTD